ncbi:MAG: LysM peptidoglycan-binding domain-containing protein, partial [Thiotrichaceae bacterium]|nr:LysM peptidoglycan-binding domain-containing protein [Thiotrichaceae bacterium]
ENLGLIAQRYNTSIKALKKTNHLKSNRIRAGKYLLVPASSATMLTQQQLTTDNVAKQSKGTKSNTDRQYTVRQGDSFWTIARRYNLSHKKLAKMNRLSSGDTLSIGQKLTIPTITNQTRLISYQVKSGDSLYLISKRFNVSIKNLKKWNKINKRNLLHPGQKLKLYQQVI